MERSAGEGRNVCRGAVVVREMGVGVVVLFLE